jgi:hypothetical protein
LFLKKNSTQPLFIPAGRSSPYSVWQESAWPVSRDPFGSSQANGRLQPASLAALPQNIKLVDRGWVGQGNVLRRKKYCRGMDLTWVSLMLMQLCDIISLRRWVLATLFVIIVWQADGSVASLTPSIHFASLKLRCVAADRVEEKNLQHPWHPNPERSSDG